MVSFNWDDAAERVGFVDQSVANTDNTDATKGKQGYDYANFSEITPDPVACWPLHEDSGTTAYDVSGNDNDGTYQGANLNQTGILGTPAPSIDGADDYINIPNISGVDFSGDATWSTFFWFYDAGKSYSELLFKPNGYEWRIRHNEDGNNQITIINYDGSTVQRVQTSASTTWGQWNPIGVSYDGSGEITIFIDGTDESFTIQTDPDYRGESPAIMLDRSNSAYGEGKLAYYNIYSADLTAAQYQTLTDVVRMSSDWLSTGWLS